jgi:hypothetical protein
VSLLPRVVLPALELEDDDLLAAAMLDDLRGDLRAAEQRGTRLDRLSVRAEQDLAELDFAPGVSRNAGNPQRSSRLDAELLPPRF